MDCTLIRSRQWRDWLKKTLIASESGGMSRQEANQLRSQVKELEREVHRKDKALAETTALLVLPKKRNYSGAPSRANKPGRP